MYLFSVSHTTEKGGGEGEARHTAKRMRINTRRTKRYTTYIYTYTHIYTKNK